MFRIGLKFPCNGLNRVNKVKKHGYSRLYLTARCYETRARIKCEPVTPSTARLFKDDKLMSRLSGHRYSTDSSKSGKSRGGGLITVGALTLGTLGVLAFAKNNPEFRATLEGWIPGVDRTIQIIFQEEVTYFDYIRNFFEDLKQSLLKIIFGDEKETKKGGAIEMNKAPKSAFTPLVEKKPEPVNENYAEIRLSKEEGTKIEVVAEKPEPPTKKVPSELMPQNLVELEKLCGEAAAKAISSYNTASCAIQDYNKDVIEVVENTDGIDASNKLWDRLNAATQKRKEALQDAEKHAGEALASLKRMYNLIDDPEFSAPIAVKTVARRNVKKILDDVDAAKKAFEKEMLSANITERYWKQVKTARENFNEELQIIFPNINIHEKKLSVNEEAFDLFVLHMYNKVTHLQKELNKLEIVATAKLNAALKASGDDANSEKINSLICLEVEKEKRILQEAFEKKLLEEMKHFDEKLLKELKLQKQLFDDSVKEQLVLKDKENQRLMRRALSEQTERASLEYKHHLAAVIGRLKGLEEALKERIKQEKGACDAQMLWSACQALARAVKVAPPGAPTDQAVRPLEPEIIAVSKAAPKEDPLVKAVIEGIPDEATKRGVFPEDALRERFLKVEKMARRLALLPEEGASLPVYLLSYLQSFLIIQTINPIPKSELEDAPIDIESLNTYDILQRARYYLDRGDFKMTLRYMNLLKGASRCIAKDWMNEARILLETQQAVDALLAYAGANGLVFLGDADTLKKTGGI
ncbi:MICOS complex subunit Mic60 isoform X2 [Belonocnema kinseyi]|uniref:MICOS complex subunit Mic60 isoform X2 n=1 Tax=Belonocnema kinseyi TaxID=2817044 RepID=UPI00143CFBB0|nr:MICOS complex subunit Mic60 isoform X2 [Belonocnema kinseyi]